MGLRPMTPDGPPILGSTPIRNVLLNVGHGSQGWSMACGPGRVLADDERLNFLAIGVREGARGRGVNYAMASYAFLELVRGGAIGKVTVVRSFHIQNEWPKGIDAPPDERMIVALALLFRPKFAGGECRFENGRMPAVRSVGGVSGSDDTEISGAPGADVTFRNANGDVVLRREVKSVEGNANSFNRQLSHAADQIGRDGEVWVQVPPGTDVDAFLRNFQRNRTDERLADYNSPRQAGVIAINFRDDDDALIGADLVSADDDILLVSRKGQAIRFRASDDQLRPMGRATSGVTGMKFRAEDEMLSMSVIRAEQVAAEEAEERAGRVHEDRARDEEREVDDEDLPRAGADQETPHGHAQGAGCDAGHVEHGIGDQAEDEQRQQDEQAEDQPYRPFESRAHNCSVCKPRALRRLSGLIFSAYAGCDSRSRTRPSQSWHHSRAVSSGRMPLEASWVWRSPMRCARRPWTRSSGRSTSSVPASPCASRSSPASRTR